MAKISELPAVAAVAGDEAIPMLSAGGMKRVTPKQIAELMDANPRARSLADAARNHVVIPRGGVFFNGGVNQTGAIKIGLPAGIDAREVSLRVLVRDHYGSLIFHLSGRNDGQWNYRTARVEGSHQILAEHPVRFGRDGTRDCIWIGNTDYAFWDNLTVCVLEATFTGLIITELWMGDWSVGLTGVFENISVGPIATNLPITTQHMKIDTARLAMAFGLGAGSGTAASNYNHIIGHYAGGLLSSGFNNCGFGLQVMSVATTAEANAGFGMQALQHLTTGVQNQAFGIHALMDCTTGIGNVAYGAGCMEYLKTGSQNSAYGTYALRDVQGTGNVALGSRAGMLWTGSNRLFIATSENEELIGGDFTARQAWVNGLLRSEGLIPANDNAHALGSASLRFSAIYCASPTINTSDESAKREIGAIPDAWLDAWAGVEWARFKYTDGARWHTGLIAQRVHAAFAAAGIDAFDIGLCCIDRWEEETAPVMKRVQVEKTHTRLKPANPKKGTKSTRRKKGRTKLERYTVTIEQMVDTGEVEVVRPAGELWGLRYDECFAIEAAWQRREIARQADRLAQIERHLAAPAA